MVGRQGEMKVMLPSRKAIVYCMNRCAPFRNTPDNSQPMGCPRKTDLGYCLSVVQLAFLLRSLSGKFSMITRKKNFICNFLQVAYKVLGKYVSLQHFRCAFFELFYGSKNRKKQENLSQVSTCHRFASRSHASGFPLFPKNNRIFSFCSSS